MNATAFGRNNPFGSKLNAIFSSDIGHSDVIDMCDPLPEAYELVEDGHITADFRVVAEARRGTPFKLRQASFEGKGRHFVDYRIRVRDAHKTEWL
jgi:hypothetical protein